MDISDAVANETLMPLGDLFFYLGWAILGLTLFGIAWIWAALTPQGRKTPPALPQVK